ncbi:hypothetical protein N7495_005576 [Penicillium taxi]|uniref:uncharacterized protein n=1 Tax=Penicillium taxi TaxID=168475 RepID=UPI0025452072|nr:uncharacterized protein N7495_005576 [Penicillium taxi]KAJ5893885.1 hypothetical protein N7495_005576 [Penicillium taxi]
MPDRQIVQIEKSVTHLLVATKQLLETLTQWSRRQATETDVSDVYVRLGYEFNLACRAFNAINVETSDLGPVPDILRSILEDTLSQDASAQSLDRYLPQIRDIIIKLLGGLKQKQARLRSRQHAGTLGTATPKAEASYKHVVGRHASAGSVTSAQSIGQLYDEAAASALPPSSVSSPQRSAARRYDSSGSLEGGTSVTSAGSPFKRGSAESAEAPISSSADREASRQEAQQMLTAQQMLMRPSRDGGPASHTAPPSAPPAFPAPPPPPKEDDALGALQRSGELERRASRRFSAYQIQKHLGSSSNGVPVLPTQNSPIPNRGRDVRESLNAVRLRGSYAHQRQRSNRLQEGNKDGQAQVTAKAPHRLQEQNQSRPEKADTTESDHDETPKPPVDQSAVVQQESVEDPAASTPSTGFPQPPKALDDAFNPDLNLSPVTSVPPQTPISSHLGPSDIATPPDQPSPGKELTLFLQYKTKIKKYVISEGIVGLTIGRLQLAFIEKFAWNTHNDGVDLPEIYIQDPISGIRHELEDLSDVKDRSVLVLNVDTLDEVKKHFDDSFGGVRLVVDDVKEALADQGIAIQRVSDRQLEASKEIARLASSTPSSIAGSSSAGSSTSKATILGSGSQIAELQSLRRDLAVLRQTYSNFTTDIASSMSSVRTKANLVKAAAETAADRTYEGDAGRQRVQTGKKELADESERLVARVDDLQDLVEDLRKDVVLRGVRPLPRQLEGVGRDISNVTKEIKKMQDFLGREKPVWTKIWEKELQLVCEERDQLTMQEDLAADLQDDLEKAAQTFALVEQATKEQAIEKANGGVSLRATSRTLGIDPTVDPMKAKDGVLGEVRALQPNHESRVEAIERSEKARAKELETRRNNMFQKELGAFVQEGRLKKSGGVEEAERLRTAKDDRIRKEVWERQQARNAEMEQAEAEATAAAAAETEPQPEGEDEDGATEASPDANKDEESPSEDTPPDTVTTTPAEAKEEENEEKDTEESVSEVVENES